MLNNILKKLLLQICFLVLFSIKFFAQNVGDFQSNAVAGNWNATSSWQQCFVAGSWAAATSTPDNTSGVITIRAGHTITVTASVAADQVIVNNTGTISILTGQTLTISNGTLTDLQIDAGGKVRCFTGTATLAINASSDVLNNGTLEQTVSTAFVNTFGTITNAATITVTGTANFKFLAGSSYKHNFISSVAVPGIIPLATWNATSTCEILCCGNTGAGPTNINQGFGNFIWNNTTQPININLQGAMITAITGNFTVNSTGGGAFSLIFAKSIAGSGSGTLTINGTFTLNSGNVVILSAANLNYGYTLRAGVYNQIAGVMTIANCTGPFAGANSTNGVLDITGAAASSITGGILNVNTGNWTGSNGNGTFSLVGPLNINTAGTLNGCSSSGAGTGVGGTISTTTGAITVGAGGIINLNSSTCTGGGGSTTLNSGGLFTISGGTVNGSSSSAVATGCSTLINANAGFTISSGTLNLTPGGITGGGGSGTMNVSGAAFTVSGGIVNINSSTGSATNGSIIVTGQAISISGGTVNVTSSSATGAGGNGTLSTTTTFTMNPGVLNLCSTSGSGTGNGLLDVDGVATFSGGTFNITSSTTTSVASGKGVVNVGGNFVHTTTAANFLRTATLATATGTINLDGTTTFQTIQSTNGFQGTIVFNINNSGVAAATTQLLAGITFSVNSGTTLNVNDNLSNITYPASELKVFATGLLKVSGIMNVLSGAVLDLVDVAGNVTTITDASSGAGTFNLNAGAGLMTQNSLGIAALGTATGCILVTGARNYNSDADYNYYGAVAQITGLGLPTYLTGNFNIVNTIASAAAGVTLSQATTVDGSFLLTTGRLFTTTTNLLTIGASGTVTPNGGAASKYVDGPVKKIGNAGFIFPIGHSYTAGPTLKWARLEIGATAGPGDGFTAQYFKLNTGGSYNVQVISQVNTAPILRLSAREYWEVTRTAGTTSNPTVKLYWQDNSIATITGSGISSTASADLRVAEIITPGSPTVATAPWTDKGSASVTTLGITGNITTSIATTFIDGTPMPFTFGANTLYNPLPIELLTFDGHSTSNGNLLAWATATELNNDYFELEKSSDDNFSVITKIAGKGNSSSLNNYSYLDINPLDGINYYRLKQVDFNGEFTYSTIISIDRNHVKPAVVNVYPNPSSDIVNIVLSSNINRVTIYNILGDVVFDESKNINNVFTFKPAAAGVYIIKAITLEGEIKTERFVKK